MNVKFAKRIFPVQMFPAVLMEFDPSKSRNILSISFYELCSMGSCKIQTKLKLQINYSNCSITVQRSTVTSPVTFHFNVH